MPILVPTSPRDATSRAPGPDFSSKPHSAAEAFFASPELVEHLFDELDHESHRVLAYMRMQFLDAFARRRYRKIDLMMMEKLLKVADTTRKQLYLSAVRELDLMSWYHPSKTLANLIKPVIQHTAAANLPVDLIFDHFDLGAGSRAGTMPGVDHNGRSNMGVSIPYFVRHVRSMLPRIEIIDLIGAQVWLPLEIQGPRYGNDYMADEIGLVTYRISDIRLNEPDERLEGVISIRYNEDLPVGYVVSDAADATTLAPKSPYLPEFLPKPEGFKIVRRVTFTAYNEEAFLMPFLQLSDEALARSVPWWPMVDEIHFRPAAQSSEHPAWSRQVSPLALLDRMLEWRSTRPPSCLTVSYMEVPSADSIRRVLRHPILRNLASLQVILGYDDRWDQGTPDITDIMQAVSDNLPVLEQLNIQASVPSEVHSRPGLTEPLSRLRRISVLTRNTELNPFNLAIYLSRCTTLATEIHIAQPSSFIPYPYEQHVADLGRAFSFDPQALYTTDLSTIGIRCPARLTAFCNLSIDERSVELEVNRSSFSNLERPSIQPAA